MTPGKVERVIKLSLGINKIYKFIFSLFVYKRTLMAIQIIFVCNLNIPKENQDSHLAAYQLVILHIGEQGTLKMVIKL